MAQVHDVADISFYRARPRTGTNRRGILGVAWRWLRVLLTDGLVADAFLVLDGNESVAVLLRRADGYVLVARHPDLAALDGALYFEADFARAASSHALARTVSLSPVWYS